jgi:putative ABC transport system ATP-binding protein
VTVLQLRAEGLGVDLAGRPVLSGVDLLVASGGSIALTGPSGSGKTVLLHALCGVMTPTRGAVLLDGLPLERDDPMTRDRFGLILQSQGLASGLTAMENVALPLQSRGLGRAGVADRALGALMAVDLVDVADRPVDDLSGGQRQRVGVARALAGSPEIFLADEPTAELDPANRARVLSLLLEPPAGRIVVIASNDPEVFGACTHVLHLRDGQVEAETAG